MCTSFFVYTLRLRLALAVAFNLFSSNFCFFGPEETRTNGSDDERLPANRASRSAALQPSVWMEIDSPSGGSQAVKRV